MHYLMVLLLAVGSPRRSHRPPTSISRSMDKLGTSISRLQDLKATSQVLINTHKSTSIIKLPTIVRCREEGDQLAFGKELVAILDDLMGTTDQVKVVFDEESGDNVGAKGERDTTFVLSPTTNILIRVRPEQITKQTSIRDIRRTHDRSNLVKRVQVRRKSTMHTKDLLINNSSNRQAIKAISKDPPELNRESPLALVVEAVDAVDTGTFVVAAEDEKVLWVLDLVGEEEGDGFEGLAAAVNVITQEKVI